MAVERRPRPQVSDRPLAKAGLNSERLLWPTKGPGVFEQEVENLEDALGLTTVAKAVAWRSRLRLAGHLRAGLLRDRDDVDRLVALRHLAVRDGALLPRRAKPTC